MLEHAVRTYPLEGGGFLHVSGMKYTFDAAKPVGKRVTEITVGTEKLDPKKSYTIALPDFLVAGGDDFKMLMGLKTVRGLGQDVEVVSDYIKSLGAPVSMTIEGRITILNRGD